MPPARDQLQRVHGRLKKANINLDRKALAEIAYSDAEAFKAIVQKLN
jgi:ribosomal protein L20